MPGIGIGVWSLNSGGSANPTSGYTYDSFGLTASDETTQLTSGTSKVTIRTPYDFIVTGVTAYLTNSGSTSTIVDLNQNGSSIFSSAITIAANSLYSIATNLSTTALTDNSILTVDIDSAGTSAKGLKLWIEGYRNQVALGSLNVIGSGSGGPSTGVVDGINTFTGGTFTNPSVNVTALTINTLTASGATSLATVSATTLYSGSTNLSTIISNIASGITTSSTFIQNGINTFTGGTTQFPTVNITAATLNNLTVTGETSLGVLSATTIYSGGTSLSTIIATSVSELSYVPVGTIIAWHKSFSGTPDLPDGWLECNGQTVTDTASPFYNKALPNLNADIYYEKNMPIGGVITGYTTGGYFLRGSTGTTGVIQVDKISTRTLNFTSSKGGSGGAKTFISMTNGGSDVGPSLNIIRDGSDAATSNSETRPHNFSVCWIIKIKATGNATINLTGQSAFSSATIGILSANTYNSGSTSFETILGRYASSSHTHSISDVNNLQGSLDSKANLSGATFTGAVSAVTLSATTLLANNLSASTLSATTFTSGLTSFDTIFGRYASSSHTHSITDINNLQGSLNSKLSASATNISDIINLAGSLSTKIDLSATTISAPTLSGGTFMSGAVSFDTILNRYAYSSHTHSISDVNNLQSSLDSKVNLSATTISAPTLSATTFTSGSTALDTIFNRYAYSSHTHSISDVNNLSGSLGTKANLSGDTFTGGISATSISATSIYSGSTNLNNVFAPKTVTMPFELGFALSDETTAITTGTSKIAFFMPFAGTITATTLTLGTTGSTVSGVDLKRSGTTIYSTKLTINSSGKTSLNSTQPYVITASTFNSWDEYTVDVLSASTGSKGMKLWITGTRTISF